MECTVRPSVTELVNQYHSIFLFDSVDKSKRKIVDPEPDYIIIHILCVRLTGIDIYIFHSIKLVLISNLSISIQNIITCLYILCMYSTVCMYVCMYVLYVII